MNKLLLACLISMGFAYGQEQETNTPENPFATKKNEFRVDVLSPIAFGKANFSYERFLGDKWSVGLSGTFSVGDKYEDDFNEGYRNTLPEYEVIPYVRYKMSNSAAHYYFIEAFVSANQGDFREVIRVDNGTNAYYAISKENYFDVAIGGSVGYKVYFAQSVVLEFIVGAGYNLLDPDKSPDVVQRIGINLGYRF